MIKTYLEMVKNDVLEVLDNYEIDWTQDADDIMDYLNSVLWTDDDVTGNTDEYTGLYTHVDVIDRVQGDMTTVVEALKELCVPMEEVAKRFLNMDWDYLDCTARCYVLGTAIYEVVSERKEK